MTKDELITLIFISLPCQEQITDLNTVSEADAITFKWRKQTFRVNENMFVETVKNSTLTRCDMSILLERLLTVKRSWLEND
jgi:hypothetical protein